MLRARSSGTPGAIAIKPLLDMVPPDIFSDDPRVLLCSSYQYPLWPDMNPSTRPGRIINCPLPPGSGGDAFRAVYTVRFAEAVYVLHAFEKLGHYRW